MTIDRRKYLYRIKRLEIKSWLKYLMLEGKHVIDYVLGELTTGTDITINNTVEKTFYKFDIKGNSTQETTTGKNKLPNNLTTIKTYNTLGTWSNNVYTYNGLTFTFNDDGTFKINGTSTGNAYVNLYFSTSGNLISDTTKTYTFTKGITNTNIFEAINEMVNSAWTPIKYTSADSTTYTPSGNSTGQIFRILIETGKTISNVTIYPMIVEGTTVGAYEPYTNGASPNPSYPQPILSAGDDGSISEKIVNKNAINPDVMMLFNSNRYIATQNYTTEGKISIKAGEIYTLICKDVFGDSGLYEFDENNTRTSATRTSTTVGSYKVLKITFSNTAKTFGFYLGSSNSFSSLANALSTSEVMLLKGDYSTGTIPTYVAHQEQTYTIPVQQPMRSVGTVRDEFIQVNGEWKERHNFESKIANENNDWAVHPNGTNSFELNNFIEVNFATNVIQIISNYFKGIKFDDRVIGGNNTIYPISNTKFVIRNTSFASLEDFKTWLTTHNTEVIYQLATPVDLPCTEEQIEILENLPKSYNEQTNIYSIDVTPAYIEVQAYVKKEEVIEND